MKKKSLRTYFIIFIGLFISLILYYNYYDNLQNEQFISLSTQVLEKENSTTSTLINERLSNELEMVEYLATIAKNYTIESAFLNTVPDELKRRIHLLTFSNFSDLSKVSTNEKYNHHLYEMLLNKTTIVCSYVDNSNPLSNKVSFLAPCSIENNKIKVLTLEYTFDEFNYILNMDFTANNINTYLISVDGTILTSEFKDEQKQNYFSMVSEAKFHTPSTHNKFENEFATSKNGLIHYTLKGIDTYAYFSSTAVPGIVVMNTASDSTILGDSIKIITESKKFTSILLISLFLLIIVLFLVGYIHSVSIRRTTNFLNLERTRQAITFSYSNSILWEYNFKTDTLIKTDRNHGICPGLTEIVGLSKYVIDNELLHPDDVDAFLQFLHSYGTLVVQNTVDVRAKNVDNTYTWYKLSGTKLYDANRHAISVIGQTEDINAQKIEIEQLKEKASLDSLTKLLNHSSTKQRINDCIKGLDSPNIMGFLIIDIDNFKTINDSLGHLFGDAVLVDVSAKLKKLFDPANLIGRVGGDEFIVLIHKAESVTHIENLANQICNIFHNIYLGENAPFEMSGSIGISIYPTDGNDFDSLYEKADTALYHAKYKGKDRYCIYSENMLPISDQYSNLRLQKNVHDLSHPHEDRSFVDTNIIASAIEILFDSREIDTSINLMLSLVGTYYNLNRIDIIEFSEDNIYASITHEWGSDPSFKIIDLMQNQPMELISNYLLFKETDNGIFFCEDISCHIPASGTEKYLYNLDDSKSILQCGISDHGHDIGYITMSICNNTHEWKKNEVDSLSLLSKIIGSYIIRLRSMQKVNLISQKDWLTDAYNFNTFLSAANLYIKSNQHNKLAIFYIDIHQFKLINDYYGYPAGDHILRVLANIYKTSGNTNYILGRITGDTFILLFDYINEDEIKERAETIIKRSKEISTEMGDYYKLNLMIGIYKISDQDSAIEAVDRANIARKNAKKDFNENYVFFNEEMRSSLIVHKEIEDVMEEALMNNEFLVYYQPKIDIDTLNISGAEALVRWYRPNVGFMEPGSFIPMFEENGFIVNVDYYVLESVCKSLRQLIDENLPVYPVSVNFSRVHFKYNVLPERLREIVQKYNIPSNLIEIEITESAFSAGETYNINLLSRICSYGFKLAMDDFGSGLSSLNLLSDLPFNIIKIDKDFFHSKTTTQRECIVISNIVRMAHELNMEVVCEGVETMEQSQFLKTIGCRIAQGYLFDRPLSKNDFEQKYIRKDYSDV